MTTQLKKGIIELCVLKLISDTPSSGVVIIEKMNRMLKVSENTVYPILRRLSEKELFQTHTEKVMLVHQKKCIPLHQKEKNN